MDRNTIVLKPDCLEKTYQIAANEFVKYYKKTTGVKLCIGEDDGVSDLVVIGSNGVNRALADWIVEKIIPPLRFKFGTDEYQIKTYQVNGRRVLLLAGGLGRSTLYAVYDYFERAFGCRYFWDGEVTPRKADKKEDFDVFEKPRFAYRGLRYFAHRGLKRFQAETWDFEDWKKELDYIVKRRMNLFMLRMGQDDLFQKAFPNEVPYPTKETMGELDYGGLYIDRRLFWPLEYRGKLRKKVLNYAFERGLLHPEDFGTMTHWYSATPKGFLEKKKPTFFSEAGGGDTANFSVWDMRERKNFENYIKLTEAHIQHYGRPDLFHTIGFAERLYSDDPDKNMLMKKYMLDRFTQYVAEKYPNAPILIAAWDIWMRYKSEEVARLIETYDESRYMIFDYTSDSVRKNNFTNWGVVGKFPYTFGIFHAYESTNDMLGFYKLTEERMAIAKADEQCKGMVLWPETAHSDTLMQEFFAVNAWSDRVVPVDEVLDKLCKDRYGRRAKVMRGVWADAMDVIGLMHWSMSDNAFCFKQYNYVVPEYFLDEILNGVRERAVYPQIDYAQAVKTIESGIACLEKLPAIWEKASGNAFIRRDLLDIYRTVIGKFTHVAYVRWAQLVKACEDGSVSVEKVREHAKLCKALLVSLKDGLALADEYRLYPTLLALGKAHKVYDGFEITLKNNVLNRYCRAGIYELVKEVFIPENEALEQVITDGLQGAGLRLNAETAFAERQKQIERAFFEKPLLEMNEETAKPAKDAFVDGLETLKRLQKQL
ncbi:MAG: hypothetical protein IJB97_08190 [Clostridia bacterium]|nr:hypothetical protein [Clostridia bacterium]